MITCISMGLIAVISDIHSNSLALERVLEDIKKRNVDDIVCLGDVVGYYTHPNECIELVRNKVSTCIAGNHDMGLIDTSVAFNFNSMAVEALNYEKSIITEENRKWLESLPLSLVIGRFRKTIKLVHGSPDDPFKYLIIYEDEEGMKELENIVKSTKCDILLVGHTHYPFKRRFMDGDQPKLFVNPGSVGQPRNGQPGAYYAIIDTEKMDAELIRLDYDYSPLQKEIRDLGLPERLASRLSEGR